MTQRNFFVTLILTITLISTTAQLTHAQRGGGDGGGRGGPGGFGGGPGGFGGGPGGFGGGPPGGFGGGPGGFGGGPPGGFGGGPGGFGGGPFGGGPGGPGGFDPTQFLARMDTNGNGSIDPDEMQGPARFMLDRMARTNPKIDMSKPIPLSVLTESFQQMRNGGGGDGRGPGEEEMLEPEKNSLVPGFGLKKDKSPVPGFGVAGEKFSVKIEERDLKEADDRLRRFDRNKDEGLDENELKEGRWTDNPMQYDRNHDGKLSRQELATRIARRRSLKLDQDATKQANANRNREAEKVEEKKEKPNPFEKQASYRVTDAEGKPTKPAGLADWFTRDDINNDGQVSMNEFTKKWTESALEEFNKFDTNQDGYITAKEFLAANKKGILRGTSSSSSTASVAKNEPGQPSSGSDPKPSGATSTPAASTVSLAAPIDARMRDWAGKKVKAADINKDGFLTPDEYKDSSNTFNKVDKNGDGRIDVDEYAASRAK